MSCVTPVTRVAGREVTTLDGLDAATLEPLVEAFDATAASQCGFCTPGILVRLAAALSKGPLDDRAARSALSAHLCRCTGFQPIVEAAMAASGSERAPGRDPVAATARATLESGTTQLAGRDVTLGRAPFADDTAPPGALVAMGFGEEGYEVAATAAASRAAAGVRQGRNSTVALVHPVALPDGEFDLVLRTTWVEPAYLEPDASWCAPGGVAASAFGNAGAFGAKRRSPVAQDASDLAARLGATVAVRWSREAVVLRGEKRPPLALGLRRDGTGAVVLATTAASGPLDEVVAAITAAFPLLEVRVVEVPGPKVGVTHRGAGLAEVLAARAVLGADEDGTCEVTTANGAVARVCVGDGAIDVRVDAGEPLCRATLRSYAIGAVHQAFSMVRTEAIALDDGGRPVDLTIRSYGITPARSMPRVDVEIVDAARPAVAAGTAVFAAALGAVWLAEGSGPTWPTAR